MSGFSYLLLSTRTKIGIARIAYNLVSGLRWICRRDDWVRVKRRGLNWWLDLSEGIDLSIYLFGSFEPRTNSAYRRMVTHGDVVLDIGANIGAHTLPLGRCVGESGRVIAFEPTTMAFERLRRNIGENPELVSRIVTEQVMLCDDDGRTPSPLLYASWPLHGDAPRHELHLGVAMETTGAKCRTLDTVMVDRGIDRVSLIKMDVDGHEMDVLRGARRTLARYRPRIIMELAEYSPVADSDTPNEIFGFLRGFGYRFSDLNGRSI
jgi:FkbM family methyltransferase